MPSSTPPDAEPSADRLLRLDRIEGEQAIVELPGGTLLELPAVLLPPGAREGSLLALVLAPTATRAAEDEAAARLARLKARSAPKKVLDL